MNYSFEYIDIILLAMIAGFIFFSGTLISAGELEINNFFQENNIKQKGPNWYLSEIISK